MPRPRTMVFAVILLVSLAAVTALANSGSSQPSPPYPPLPAPSTVIEQYSKSQSDPSADARARICAAVDTYFRLQLMGIIEQRVYDSAFLVDLSSASGQTLYNYEIGRLEFSLAWWKEARAEYADFRYLPTYEFIQVEGSVAAVAITVQITLWDPSGSSFTVSVEHDLTLAATAEGWKIVDDTYEDVFKGAYPVGTDFSARMPSPGGNEEVPPEVIPEAPPGTEHSWLPTVAWASAIVATVVLLATVTRMLDHRRTSGRR